MSDILELLDSLDKLHEDNKEYSLGSLPSFDALMQAYPRLSAELRRLRAENASYAALILHHDEHHDETARLQAENARMTAEVERLTRDRKLIAEGIMNNEGLARTPSGSITDGFGNYWHRNCPNCGAPMLVVRPGDARCSAEC